MQATRRNSLIGRVFALSGALAALAGMPLAAHADVKAGVDAWGRGDYAAAIREWQGPAERGDPDALFNLAQAHKLGRGVKPDLVKAEDYYSRAAMRGHLQAADNFGLLLFQRGEHARAMPFIQAAASRGDPRAQYLLGLAHFNADNVARDWVRAYALVSLAQQAGLPQAAAALAQMDQHIPLDQRQQSVVVASELAANAEATRARQIAATDLGVRDQSARPVLTPPRVVDANQSMGMPAVREPAVTPEMAASADAHVRGSPQGSGADYARPRVPALSGMLDQATSQPPAQPVPPVVTAVRTASRPSLPPAPAALARPAPARVAAAPARVAVAPARVAADLAAAPRPVSAGDWRVQLGAFGVAANADRLWAKVRGRPELAGHARRNEPAGRLIKLQATGFASQADAQAACSRLASAGVTCLPVRD